MVDLQSESSILKKCLMKESEKFVGTSIDGITDLPLQRLKFTGIDILFFL
jgi:hypothetical protein